jgi:hypothetical protein
MTPYRQTLNENLQSLASDFHPASWHRPTSVDNKDKVEVFAFAQLLRLGLLICKDCILRLLVFKCRHKANHTSDFTVFFLIHELWRNHVFSFVEHSELSSRRSFLHLWFNQLAVFCANLFRAFRTRKIDDLVRTNDLNRVSEAVVNIKVNLVRPKPFMLFVDGQERHRQSEVVRTRENF